MTPPDKLVQAAAEAITAAAAERRVINRDPIDVARIALAAAFAALPAYIEDNPPEPIVVGRHPQWFRGFDDCLAYLAREFGEPT